MAFIQLYIFMGQLSGGTQYRLLLRAVPPRNYTHGSWLHDDVIKWKLCPRYWPFVRGIWATTALIVTSLQCVRYNRTQLKLGFVRREIKHLNTHTMNMAALHSRLRHKNYIYTISRLSAQSPWYFIKSFGIRIYCECLTYCWIVWKRMWAKLWKACTDVGLCTPGYMICPPHGEK